MIKQSIFLTYIQTLVIFEQKAYDLRKFIPIINRFMKMRLRSLLINLSTLTTICFDPGGHFSFIPSLLLLRLFD